MDQETGTLGLSQAFEPHLENHTHPVTWFLHPRALTGKAPLKTASQELARACVASEGLGSVRLFSFPSGAFSPPHPGLSSSVSKSSL